ncbi:YceD family protein [Sandaracinus amylolyticus]|uniref:YceD family protein n=1 Tax=Sandaracinus amylolyticus TaxID=927083 RepID=UPI001F31D68C|nr:YceD family protein [Sandaracinus amylolyticus]UJR80660.1 Hypothetical protein I5071_27090 [Sandaracinus amylolyticus]
MAEFEIKVLELEAGGKQYDFPLRRGWLDASLGLADAKPGDALKADPAQPDGVVSVWAEKSGEDVVVRGRVKTHLIAECARCLGEAHVPVDTAITALFTLRSETLRPVADEEDLTPEELDTEFYRGDTVALDALVREHVLLEVPMQTLCSETCTGLEVPAAIRGPADLHEAPIHEGKKVDPRLAPLMDLMDKTKKKGS